MRENFFEFYTPSESDFDALWREATIVVDANILLSLLRHPPETADEIRGFLEVLRGRLWLPYQIGLEFHCNRYSVLFATERPYARLEEVYKVAFASIKEQIEKMKAEYRYHPSINFDELHSLTDTLHEQACGKVEEFKKSHPVREHADKLVQAVTSIFAGKIGPRPSEAELATLTKIAKERFSKQVPPGYMDAKKDEAQAIGDFLIWRQILDYASAQKKSILFITDDVKEDWYQRSSGRTIGNYPRVQQERF